MNTEVKKAGLYTSIQDFGRDGYARFGVPQSGGMDRYSAKVANLLVGNSAYEAVLEMTLMGAQLRFPTDTRIAIAGLGAQIELNGKKQEINTVFEIGEDQVLKIGQITSGFRVYLTVHGGIQSEKILDSRSMFQPITAQNKLTDGAKIPISDSNSAFKPQHAGIKYDKKGMQKKELPVQAGPEFLGLPHALRDKLLKQTFHISKNNSRVAYQLKEKLPNNFRSMLTAPVLPGTVQLTPAGNIIILMRDCQTTGGYPRILQLTQQAINQISQKKQGDPVVFEKN